MAGAGVVVGTNFSFNVAGTPITVAAGAGPGGTCGAPVTAAAGNAVITETVPVGFVLTGVASLPAGSLVSSNLATGTATVTVVAGAQTTVTFTDQTLLLILRGSNMIGRGTRAGIITFDPGPADGFKR